MKPRIPRDQLLSFARECLKLEELLSVPDDVVELGKFLSLLGAMEKSGGIAALEELLQPENTVPASRPAAPPLKDALRPVQAPHTEETS